MAVPLMLCFFVKNVSWKKLLKILAVFGMSFGGCFIYLNFSNFTNWYTAVWTSLIVSGLMTFGISTTVYLRCAAVLFFVQCLSRFGLCMIFLSLSWMMLQRSLGILLHNHVVMDQIMAEQIAEGSVQEFEEDYELKFVRSLLGVMHYSVLTPFVLIYGYSILYELTFVTRASYRRSGKRLSKGKVYITCLQIGKNFMMFLTGVVFSATLMAFLAQRLAYKNMVLTLKKMGMNFEVLGEMPMGWLTWYLISSTVIMIIVPFSKIVTKCRAIVIQKYFKIYHGNIHAKTKHVYITKSDDKRITMQELQRSREEKQTTGPRDTQLVNAAQSDTSSKIGHQAVDIKRNSDGSDTASSETSDSD